MFDPPPQLRTRTDLDGLHIKVSGRPTSALDVLRSENARALLWVLTAFFIGLAFAGLSASAFLAVLAIFALRALPRLEPTRGALEAELTLTPTQLVVDREGERTEIPWTQVGIVSVTGGSEAVVSIRRAGAEEPLAIGMELEPVEHAVWVSMIVEDRAREARRQLGTVADVPASIRRLRT